MEKGTINYSSSTKEDTFIFKFIIFTSLVYIISPEIGKIFLGMLFINKLYKHFPKVINISLMLYTIGVMISLAIVFRENLNTVGLFIVIFISFLIRDKNNLFEGVGNILLFNGLIYFNVGLDNYKPYFLGFLIFILYKVIFNSFKPLLPFVDLNISLEDLSKSSKTDNIFMMLALIITLIIAFTVL